MHRNERLEIFVSLTTAAPVHYSMQSLDERRVALLALALAVAGPTSLAFNLPPSATFFNQAFALGAWGFWLLATGAGPAPFAGMAKALGSTIGALVLLGGAAILSGLRANFSTALSLSTVALIGLAFLTLWCAAAPAIGSQRVAMFLGFSIGLALAGLASSLVGIVQVFASNLTDGGFVARTSVEGRAVGNVRQPNQLCTLLLWSMVSTVWLLQQRRLRAGLALGLGLLFMFATVLSGSRSGVVGSLMLAVWGATDTRLPRRSRAALMLSPVAYLGLWAVASTVAGLNHLTFGGAVRSYASGDISSSRFAIWSNTLDLIRAHPWFGVGFGEFNFAWTLTEFPNRPVAFFDHTHNLPLQFAVELGLPLAAIVLGLLGWGLWRAWRNCLRPPEPNGTPSPQRAAFVMLVLILVHSLLEYPLWYAYFLLPTAFLFGLCLATPPAASVGQGAATRRRWGMQHLLRTGAILMMIGALYSVYDYLRVVVIFAPPEDAAPLAERIAIGQRSTFFSHHADYAAATTSDDPDVALPAARRAAHYLLDTRLMVAWANALNATGDTERAKYLAQRLVEFRNPMSEPYFAPCKDPALVDAQRPYQCFAPQRKFTFEDFR